MKAKSFLHSFPMTYGMSLEEILLSDSDCAGCGDSGNGL